MVWNKITIKYKKREKKVVVFSISKVAYFNIL